MEGLGLVSRNPFPNQDTKKKICQNAQWTVDKDDGQYHDQHNTGIAVCQAMVDDATSNQQIKGQEMNPAPEHLPGH